MGKLWMPMNNFKKVQEDDQSATLQHPDGHQIKLAKNILSDHMKQQLAALPIHGAKPSQPNLARGGRVKKYADGGLSCGSCGQVQNDGQPTGVANPQMSGQPPGQPQQGGPTNPAIPTPSAGGPQMNPFQQGIKGIFGGQNATGLMNQGVQQQLQGAKAGMQAQQAGAGMSMQAAQQGANDLQGDLNKFWNGWTAPDGRQMPGYSGRLQEIDNVKQDILTNHIDPNRFIEQGALPKVMTAIGLLGTMANARGGGHQILSFINDQMQRDVQAQIADKSGKVNVLQANLQQLGNMRDAIQMTSAQHQAMMSALLEKAAATTNSQMAKANYLNYAGQIHQQMAKQVYDWTMGGVLGQKVGAGGVGQGQPGQGGGAQAGGCGPTDAVGNPLPQGLNINPSYYQQNGPVKLPGGGYGFAGDPQSAEKAKASVSAHDQLDAAIKGVQQAQSTGAAFPSVFGMMTKDRAAKAGAMDALHQAVRNVVTSGGKLTPLQQEALKNLSNIPENPMVFKGSSQQRLQDLGNTNNDAMNAQLGSYVQNYEAPAKPRNNKQFNGG